MYLTLQAGSSRLQSRANVPSCGSGGMTVNQLKVVSNSVQKLQQQPPNSQTATKCTTKALHTVDPTTTNKPLGLDSSSSKSKSAKRATMTSLTQNAKQGGFMAKISGKSNSSEDSIQTGPSMRTASLTLSQTGPTMGQKVKEVALPVKLTK